MTNQVDDIPIDVCEKYFEHICNHPATREGVYHLDEGDAIGFIRGIRELPITEYPTGSALLTMVNKHRQSNQVLMVFPASEEVLVYLIADKETFSIFVSGQPKRIRDLILVDHSRPGHKARLDLIDKIIASCEPA